MPDLDPNIILSGTAPAQPFDPLKTLGSIQALRNAQAQNTLLQNENTSFQQKQAAGRTYANLFAGNTGTDGTINSNGLLSGLASQAAGNPAIGEYVDAVQKQQGVQTQNATLREQLSQEQAKTHYAHAGLIGSALAPLLTMDNPTLQDVAKIGADVVGHADNADPDMAKQWASAMGSIGSNPNAAQIKAAASKQILQSQGAQEALAAAFPEIQGVDTGGEIRLRTMNRFAPAGAQSQDVTDADGRPITILKTLTPGELAAPRQTYRNRQPGTVPTSAAVGPTGQPLVGDGFQPTGAPLGAGVAADVASAATAKQGQDLQARADQVPASKALLENLEEAMKHFTPGPGADWKRSVGAAINANSPFGNIFDPKSIAKAEDFNKQAVQLAQQQFQALGGTGTDAKLGSAMHTSPNAALSAMGNKDIIGLLKGNEDAITAKNQAWQAWQSAGNGPETYGRFSTSFNKIYDPRVFQSVYARPGYLQSIVGQMNAKGKAAFANAYNTAVSQGWIPDPRGH